MITIDGSRGEGGGQILRTSLALSLATRKAFRIENIRAGRAKPGLLRQHLTSVQAAAAVGDAEVQGAEMRSLTLTFTPRALRGGDYHFVIGTAGSTMLVLQTILLPLMLAPQPSTVEIEGGTHNPAAPPFDFLRLAFLPLLRADVALAMIRAGFYPQGGGKIRAEITPSPLRRIELETRGAIVDRREQQLRDVRSVIVEAEHVTEVFTSFGREGDANAEADRYLATEAAAGEHLADQLLLPMALGAGGSFTTTTPLTGHTTTNIETIGLFLDRTIATEELGGGVTRVRVD